MPDDRFSVLRDWTDTYIPLQVQESVFANAENPIFDSEKTAPIANSGLVFSESNLWLSALAKFRFLNLKRYILPLALAFLCVFSSSSLVGREKDICTPAYVIVLYGAPGSGRASMSIRLRKDFSFPTISLATLLTNHVLEGTTLGSKGRDYLINGGELPQELLPAILCDRLSQKDCARGAFLEDMSLTVSQVLDIEKQLAPRFQFLIVNIDSSDEFLVQRVERRFVCYNCGHVYDDTEPGRKQRTQCDICCSALQRRQGDTPNVIKARLEAYRTQVAPLLELYKNQRILMQIPGNRDYDDVYKDIVNTIEHITGLTASKTRFEEDLPLLAQE